MVIKNPNLTAGKLLKILRKMPTSVPIFVADMDGDGCTRIKDAVVMKDDKHKITELILRGIFTWEPDEDDEEEQDEEGIPYGDTGGLHATVAAICHAHRIEYDVSKLEVDCVNHEANPFLQLAE